MKHKRRSFFTKALGALGLVGWMSIPAYANKPTNMIKGRFIHMVFFWLKDSTDPDLFIQSSDAFLKQIKEIRSYHLGKPAGTPRDVVDNSYGVSLVVTFDSKEEQDIYQNHPVHVQYVEDNKEKWSRVQIYDSWGAE